MRILADQNIPFVTEAFNSLSSAEQDEVVLFDGRQLSATDMSGADVLLVRSVTAVNESLLADCDVQFIASATIGTDHIDFDYLKKKKIQKP